ncbi:MAG: hypothetical protein JWP97_153 [Labilithrix sp.]|nr:hypothetical protein [Labilithrix sp.]
MHHCVFEMRYETGKTERIEVESSRILIGSGAHCDLRLAPEVAAWEHLVLTEEDGGMVVRLLPGAPLALLDGATFRDGRLADGSRLVIGEVSIVYRPLGSTDAKKQKKGPRFALLLGGLFVPAALLVAFHARSDTSFGPPDKVPQPLGEVITQCPAATREQARVLAHEKETAATAKRQRWKFYTRDGVESVVLFEQAAACQAAAGDEEAAKGTSAYAASMRAGVLQEYQVYRVRLERALERDDAKVALQQVRFLREMLFTRDIDDDYVRWLTILQRKLEARVSQQS